MRFYIGTPPVERLALADTGSDLIWVQCTPCRKCKPQNTPLFDPTKSSTYRRVRCDSQPCTLLSQNERRCGNTGPLSLISQLGDQIGRKFLYCFLPLVSNSTSKMKFGDEATIKGSKGVVVSTPLILKPSSPSFYYLNLEAISVGKKEVKISKGKTDGNILIDSGSTYHTLEQGIFNKFVTLVKEVLGVEAVKIPPAPYSFCFKDKNHASEDFTEVVFHFTGGANVIVGASTLFNLEDDNLICASVTTTTDEDGSIFGNQATVGYQVEYDFEGGTISFAPADCAKY